MLLRKENTESHFGGLFERNKLKQTTFFSVPRSMTAFGVGEIEDKCNKMHLSWFKKEERWILNKPLLNGSHLPIQSSVK
jgi:hypothetical protein